MPKHQSNRSIKILKINITYRNRNDIDVEIHNRRSEPSEETPTNQQTSERESKYKYMWKWREDIVSTGWRHHDGRVREGHRWWWCRLESRAWRRTSPVKTLSVPSLNHSSPFFFCLLNHNETIREVAEMDDVDEWWSRERFQLNRNSKRAK